MDLNKIIIGCQNKKPDAQRALVEKYSGILYSICRRYCYRQMDSRDVLQDAFIMIFKNFHQYDVSKGSLDSWIKRVTINVALRHNQKQKIFTIDINDQHDLSTGDESVPISKMTADELIELIAKLPSQYRTVFNMYVVDGFSHKEIGEKMGITASTSRSNLSRAKTMLKKLILKNEKSVACRRAN